MELRDRIVYTSHIATNNYGFRRTVEYLKKYPEVDVWTAQQYTQTPLYWPKNIKELDMEYVKNYGPIFAEPLFRAYTEADKAGYGAAVCPSWGDGGVDQALKTLKMPVIGISKSAFTKAAHEYGRFSILHNHLPETAPRTEQRIKDLGFWENYVSTERFEGDVYQWIVAGKHPDFDELIRNLLPVVKGAVKKGARVMLFACASPDLSDLAGHLSKVTLEEFGVPALGSIDTAIEFAQKAIREAKAKRVLAE